MGSEGRETLWVRSAGVDLVILVCGGGRNGNSIREACRNCLCIIICTAKDEGFKGIYIEDQKCLEYSRAVQSYDCEVIVG